MNPKKLLFDSCCFGQTSVSKLKEFLIEDELEVEIAHLRDFKLDNSLDDVWVPKMVQENWVVVSSDRGTTKSKGSKLPLLCKKFRMTHILLSASVHNLKSFEKVKAILSAWPELGSVFEAENGTEFRLQKRGQIGFRLIEQKPDTPRLKIAKIDKTA